MSATRTNVGESHPKRGREEEEEGDGRASKKTKPLDRVCRAIVRWESNHQVELRGSPRDFHKYGLVYGDETKKGVVNELTDTKMSPFIAFATNVPQWLQPLVEEARTWLEEASDEVILAWMWEAAELESSFELPLGVWTMFTLFHNLVTHKKGWARWEGVGLELRMWPAET